jgi:predicted RNA-binding protein
MFSEGSSFLERVAIVVETSTKQETKKQKATVAQKVIHSIRIRIESPFSLTKFGGRFEPL